MMKTIFFNGKYPVGIEYSNALLFSIFYYNYLQFPLNVKSKLQSAYISISFGT